MQTLADADKALEEIRADPIADQLLRNKQQWEKISALSVLEGWGDPRDWPEYGEMLKRLLAGHENRKRAPMKLETYPQNDGTRTRCCRCGRIVGEVVTNYPQHPSDTCPYIPDKDWKDFLAFVDKHGRYWRSAMREAHNRVSRTIADRHRFWKDKQLPPYLPSRQLEIFQIKMGRPPHGFEELYYVHVGWTAIERVKPNEYR